MILRRALLIGALAIFVSPTSSLIVAEPVALGFGIVFAILGALSSKWAAFSRGPRT